MQGLAAIEMETPKRRATKPRLKPAKIETATKQKLTLYVSAEGAKRLGVHATMLGTDRSALVEQLIADHLKRFVVSDRAKADGESNRPDSSAQASNSEPVAA